LGPTFQRYIVADDGWTSELDPRSAVDELNNHTLFFMVISDIDRQRVELSQPPIYERKISKHSLHSLCLSFSHLGFLP
jgi:hypothetical protein